jgi:SRSO17 transposase
MLQRLVLSVAEIRRLNKGASHPCPRRTTLPLFASRTWRSATRWRIRLRFRRSVPHLAPRRSDPTYVVGVQSTITVWPAGKGAAAAKPKGGPKPLARAARRPIIGRPLPKRWRRRCRRRLGESVAAEGSDQTPTSRLAAERVRPASRDCRLAALYPLECLLIEWPDGERGPTKYWLSTPPEDTSIEVLADAAKLC